MVRALVEGLKSAYTGKVYSLLPDTLLVPAPEKVSVESIEKALSGTPYSLSEFEGCIFLMPGKNLKTNLQQKKYQGQTKDPFILSVIANSENLVYDIGSPLGSTDSEEVILTGQVCNFKSGEAIVGAQVLCRTPWATVLTGSNGEFSLTLPKGNRVLEISSVDISNTIRRYNLQGDGYTRIDLEDDGHMLDEIVVQARRVEQVHSTQIGVEKFNPLMMRNIPFALGETDVLKMLQTLPGVTTVGEASNGYNVRGGATDQNLILYNNNTIFNPNHMFALFTAFNSDVIDEAELFKSSIPAQYGGRISSILNINSKEANKETISGSASIGLLTTKLNIELPLVKNKLSLLLNGRMTYSDWMLKHLPEKSGYRNGRAGFYDTGGVLSWTVNEKNKVNLYGYYSHDHFSFTEDEKYGYSNMNFSASWKSFLSDILNTEVAVGYDHYDYYNDQNASRHYEGARLSYAIHQLFLKTNASLRLEDKHDLNLGLQVDYDNVRNGKYEPLYPVSFIEPQELEWDNALTSGFYINDNWTISEKLSIEGGIRWNIYNFLGPKDINIYADCTLPTQETLVGIYHKDGIIKTYMGPELRLSARYSLKDNLSLKVGAGNMHQFIHKVSNTTIMSPTDIWKLSDTNIKPQKGWQFAAGVYHESPRRNWEYSLEGYYKILSDYLSYRNGASLLLNSHIETDVINTEGYAYGMEIQVKKPYGNLNGWISYSYSRTFLRQNDPRVASPVNGGNWFPAEYDRPHQLKFVGNYKFTQRFNISANLDYSTGRPTTIPAGKYFDKTLNRIQPYYVNRNTYRVPDYFRIDFSANIEPGHHRTRLLHTSYSFGVYNVLGRKNTYNIYYIVENGEMKGYQLSVFGAPIPYVNINLNF